MPPSATIVYADRVIAYVPTMVPGWPYPSASTLALGAPGGPQDVLRLGHGGSLTLGLGNAAGHACILPSESDDFVIYSNAEAVTDPVDGPGNLSQAMRVEVSQDSVLWYFFPYRIDPSAPLVSPSHYPSGLAGIHVTTGTGASAAGGDAFRLASIPNLAAQFEACYVRVTDAWGIVSDYGDQVEDSWQGGAGLDAIASASTVSRPNIAP